MRSETAPWSQPRKTWPQLTQLLRLTRNLDDVLALVKGLTRKGVRAEFLKETLIVTGEDSPMANPMLFVMGPVAEFERSLTGKGKEKALP